ncbi:MAG: hypothetical protein KJ928_00595, partial [Candidatus Altiarchaeota archaeon]|nr:hypothetical protein [Candidatus Altiarchaeota archaeon]
NLIRNVKNAYGRNSNFWDNGEKGNHWSDYNGTDSDEDGVGDTPYEIPKDNQDGYPLMAPYGCPVLGDADCDGIVSDLELLDYMDAWRDGTVGDMELLNAIAHWV